MSATRTSRGHRVEPIAAVNPRASERVMEYLLAEFDRPELKEGCRLPTIRELSSRLSVSQPTVHGVLQRLVKQGRVRTVAGSGSYLVHARSKSSDTLNIALSIPLPEGQAGHYWSHRIAAAIVIAVCQSDRRIKIVPLPRHVASEEETVRKLLEERSQVDGLILSPLMNDEEVRRAYESDGKPVVDINPPSHATTANYVSADYFGANLELGKAWKQTGRKRVVLLGMRLDDVWSEHLMCAGLMAGLGARLGNEASFKVVEADSIDERSGSDAIQPILANRSSVPDAIFCAGDYLALGVLRACRDLGLRVPEDVSVVGGTGLDLSDSICPQLTRLKQPFDQLGKELVSLVCGRIDQKNISLPGRIVPTVFMGGGTTRAEENAVLGIQTKGEL